MATVVSRILAEPVAAVLDLPFSLFSSRYIPHRYCYLAQPGLVWTNAVTDGLIGLSYVVIFTCLLLLVRRLRRIPEMRPYLWILLSFGAFIIACAGTHLMDVVTVWQPFYPLSAAVKVLCAVVSIPTALYFAKTSPAIAGSIRAFLNSRAEALQAKVDNLANYKGKMEAIEASHMVTEFDLQGRLLRANANFLTRMGYVEDELAGQDFGVLLTAHYKQSVEYRRFWSELRAGRTQAGQFERVDKQGRIVHVYASYHPVLDPQGGPFRVIGMLTDITEQRKTQRELRDAEAKLRIIMDNVLAGIIMIDFGGTILSMNPAAVRMFEYSADEVVGQNVKMLMPTSGRDNHDGNLAGHQPAQLSEEIGRDLELEGLTRNGRAFPIEVTFTEASFQEKRIFIGLVRDISERKRFAEEARQAYAALVDEQAALQDSNTRASLAADSAGIGIWDWDIDRDHMLWDAWMYRLYGLPPKGEEPAYELWTRHLHPEDRSFAEQAIQDALVGTRPFNMEFRVVWADGSVHFIRAAGQITRDADGRAIRMVGTNFDITARKASEESLRQSYEKEQLLILGTKGFAVFMLDLDGTVLSWNEGAERIKGYRSDEIIGCNFSKLYRPADAAAGRPALGLAIAAEQGRYEEDAWRMRKDGTYFWANVCTSALYDQTGKLRGFGKVTRDISERKKQEEERDRQERALRKSEELLDRTGRMAGVGGWEIDLVHRTMYWTDETARLQGFEAGHQPTLEEAIHLFVPEFQPALRAAIEKAAIDGQPWELEAQLMRADGSRIWAMKKASVEVLDGKAVRMVGAFQDVTARVLAEEEVRYQANLLDVSHDTIMMRDLDGRIRFWNQGAQEMYGYSKQDAAGQISHTLLQTVFPAPLAEIEAELTAEGRWEGELGHTTRSGLRIVVASRWVLQQDQNGRTFNVLETNNDITERKRAEEVSRKATFEAEEANRAKSEFLANMSHEIRTPMNAIMGMTHLALRANPTPQQGGYLRKIGSAADSLLNIINDILDFSKMEAGKMELENIRFRVERVLLDLNDIMSQTAKRKNIAISFSISEEVPEFLVGDPLRLGQILINLVNNGIKFTREGSVIVTVSAARHADLTAQVSFAVVDTGIGMSEEQLAKLFQSFNQADASVTRNFGGTGLGLAISKQLCELMGGTISAVSKEGKGSTFTLQVQFGIATGIESFPAGEENQDPGRKTVLVVDDSADARDVLVAMLTANGFDSRTVSTGEEVIPALDAAWGNNRPFDLVLMDWRMPGINGLETAREINARLEDFHVPSIIMVSAFEREQVMHGVSDPGLEGFLVKPVKESVLIETVRALLQERHEENGESAPSNMPVRVFAQPSDLAGRRVLLVEDNEINRDLATELLTDLGILVSVAVDGREGVDRIAAEPFDLVLMDIQMPVMDGLTATRLVRSDSRFRALPIIAMTAHAMSGDREKSLAAGMNDHLTKPISPDRLTDTLLRWMPGRLPSALSTSGPGVTAIVPTGEGLPEELPPFDLRAALMRTNGKPKLLRKMMLSFRNQYAGAGRDLRLLMDQGRTQEAERLAHSLKGSARTLEADQLGDAAEAIEVALRTGATKGLLALIDSMEEALTPAITAAASLDRRALATDPVEAPLEKLGSTILIVDDDPAYLELLTDIFSKEHIVLSASSGVEAVAMAKAMAPDAILLDVMMPDLDGFEVCSLLKNERLTCDIPVIFLTGLGDVENESKALTMGAVDYVTKPINPLAVRARVDHQIQLKHAHDRLMQLATDDLLAQLRKEAEHAEELKRINEHELELRDHFLSHVSHELRSPLTSIYMFSTLIADGLAGVTTPEQDEYLGFIDKNVSQLKAMVDDLLTVTAAKTGKLAVQQEAASLSAAVVDAIHTLQGASLLKGVSLSSSVGEDVAAYADPMRLLQVLIILFDNAIKFTPSGGSVAVEAHPFAPDPNFLLVEVSDTGCGIRPELAERIFEHLYQISEVSDAGRSGLGLGLHIAKELITMHGGRIWAEALPAGGSRFSFTLPVVHKEEKVPA